MSSSDHKENWDRFICGEKGCFKKIFEGYYEELYGYGLKIVDKHKLVEDAIQELFEDIWRRRSELDHVESPRVYLFVSLRRSLIRKTKKKKRKREKLKKFGRLPKFSFSKEEIIIKRESARLNKEEFRDALNQLSDRQKEVVYLHFFNGMTYREIEEILSINRQSVRNYVYRAMESLRSLLKFKLIQPMVLLFVLIADALS